MERWFCIAGREKELSAAELWARLSTQEAQPDIRRIEDVLVVDSPAPASLSHLLATLGGCTKIGKVLFSSPAEEVTKKILEQLFDSELLSLSDRVIFGISAGGAIPSDVAKRNKVLGMKMKKELAGAAYRSRLVSADEPALSSVSVTKNELLTAGGEIYVIFDRDGQVLVGRTEAVQDFESYSERDYDRPGRSMHQGMLPPKLAQVMINLSQTSMSGTLLDPFCGSGTILQEASLMGFHHLIGTDVDRGAIQRTLVNQQWMREQYPDVSTDWRIEQWDATKLRAHFSVDSVDAIIGEGDLGPTNPPRSLRALQPIVTKLQSMYEAAIAEFGGILKPGGRVVLAVPRWHTGGTTTSVQLHPALVKAGFQPLDFPASLVTGPLQYYRPGQRVGRDILAYEKKK